MTRLSESKRQRWVLGMVAIGLLPVLALEHALQAQIWNLVRDPVCFCFEETGECTVIIPQVKRAEAGTARGTAHGTAHHVPVVAICNAQ